MFHDAALLAMYRAVGEAVLYRSHDGAVVTNAYAIFNAPGTIVFGGQAMAADPSFRYPVTSFPRVVRGDTFEVGGVLDKKTWRVRQAPQALNDGKEALCLVETLS